MESFTVANPIFIPAPFARDSAYKNTIQKTRQSGQDQEDMTWTDGAPLITMTPKDNGGLAPKGQDFNGVLNAATENTVFVQNGGRYKWSSDVITNYGGYAKDAIIQSDDGVAEYISLVDDNTVNPNSTLGTSWAVYAGQGSIPAASSTIAGVTKVLNNLNSTDTGSALSAAQGKVLNDNKVAISSIVNNLNSTATNQPLSAAQGKILNDYLSRFDFNTEGIKIPLGTLTIILKWGVSVVDGDSNASINFPVAFPATCLNAQATLNDVSFNSQSDAGCGVVWSRTGLTLRNGTANQINVSWFAIGY